MSLSARVRVFGLLALLVPIFPAQVAQASSPAAVIAQTAVSPSPFTLAMQAAAQARHVPLALIEATAYVNTRWEWIATPAHDGGVGPMNVRPSQMSLASSLSGRSASEISGDLQANVDAGAALLAHYHSGGSDLPAWQPAVTATQGAFVEGEIFDVLQTGATRTTSTGETITLDPQPLPSGTKTGSSSNGSTGAASAAGVAGAAPAATSSSDFPTATWVPADPSNYSVANRPHDYPIDMIVIHDIEGSYGSAIQDFQTPGYAASAHYVVSYQGQIAQMVLEKNIAWHAGNWDYNTRSIGIEHEGFAAYNLYTTAEYNASAALAASICSRYGVPMDRNHVIGHSQVPDPNNPGLYGGRDHHWDPGPYWNWTYYMATAQADTRSLPSPPRMMPDPVATSAGPTSITVTWQPARTCRVADAPITGYTVVAQPGNITMSLPTTATTANFTSLQNGTRYTFTVTAANSYGTDSLNTNPVIAGSCAGAGLAASPSSPQVVGAKVNFTATSAACATPRYQFWILPPGGAWTVVQPYSPTATFSWDTTNLAYGTYGVAVWARDANSAGNFSDSAGAYDSRASLQFVVSAPPCTAMTATPSIASPIMRGPTVTLTAVATGCSNPQYEFWILPPGGIWTVARAYSTSPTFTWSTAGQTVGTYRFSVWALNTGSVGTGGAAPNVYDTFSAFDYSITAGCPSMAATASPSGAALVGTPVMVTGGATGCPNPRYEFWLLPPGGVWTVVQPYSASATFSWSTQGRAAGSYRFSVWARDASSSSAYDTFSAFQYSLTVQPCTSMSASASPAKSATLGTPVTVTGSATGCPNPRYEFWLLPPGGVWTVVQPYSASATFSWSTQGRAAGSYRFSVWARDASSSSAYDTFSAFQYLLTVQPCTSMSASASPVTSATLGTPVTVSGSASGCPNPRYEFWLLPPGGVWTVVQPYSPSTTFSWSTQGRAAGSYRFSVWARDASSSSAYDTFSAFQYTLTTAPPCTAISATASPSSPAAAGAMVTVTAGATGCASPMYEFWLLAPGSTWVIVQGYSPTASFRWATTGLAAGTYRFSVWVRDASSPGTNGSRPYTYDAFDAFDYTLN